MSTRFTKHELQVMHEALDKYLNWYGDEEQDIHDDHAAREAQMKIYFRLKGDAPRSGLGIVKPGQYRDPTAHDDTTGGSDD